jgi:hypothetical protein
VGTVALGRFLFPRVEVKIVHEHAAPVPGSYEWVKNLLKRTHGSTSGTTEPQMKKSAGTDAPPSRRTTRRSASSELLKRDDPEKGRVIPGVFLLADEVGCGKSKQGVDATQFAYDWDAIDTVVALCPGAG